jgi:2-keto-4-pentenoate hydratase/acetyl esterase/lipase
LTFYWARHRIRATTVKKLSLILCFSIFVVASAAAIEPSETFAIWPGVPPGTNFARGDEKKVEGRPRPFYQLTDISKPTVSVFLPAKERRLGTALLVLPGGGLQRLAYEHEGLEVAEWAVAHGLAAFVVKYRVPAPAVTATEDGQRALSLVRARAKEWDVDPESIGAIGFSAGAEVAAWMSTHPRLYKDIDANDSFSCRPDFVAMIYPGGLTGFGNLSAVKEPIASRINGESPPMFFAQASDDAAENTLAYALALKKARVPVEVHLYRDGAHGFGVRNSGSPVGTWTARFEDWMRSLGYLDTPAVRSYARSFAVALKSDGGLPRFPEAATLEDAFAAQKRFVRGLKEATIAGFKGGVVTAEAQKSLGLDFPITGVLLNSGRLNAADKPVIRLAEAPDTVVETELGYVIGENLATQIANDTQARECVQSIVPVIELPQNYARRTSGGAPTAKDMVASNMGSTRFIVGTPKKPMADADAIKVSLKRDGQTLHETTGAYVKGGQWANLRLLLNQLTAHGNTVHAGAIIICGALGGPKPGEPGKYQADYGDLGSIEFELQK